MVSPSLKPPPPKVEGIPVPAVDKEYVESDECLMTVVHRHPLGIFLFYVEAAAFFLAVILLLSFTLSEFLENLTGHKSGLALAVGMLVAGIITLVLFVATYIYRQNRLLVTDKSLVQILQKGLFTRKVSRLSMSNVEDVSAEHRGILSTIFNYGILTIQTAGERENFLFTWCPDPDTYADRILDARQAYAQQLGEGEERVSSS